MTLGEKLTTVGLIAVLVFAIWMAVLQGNLADEECQRMLARAQSASDTLVVAGMKPYSKIISCSTRLEME